MGQKHNIHDRVSADSQCHSVINAGCFVVLVYRSLGLKITVALISKVINFQGANKLPHYK